MEETSLIADGTVDFVGGQDASKTPDLVPENAIYSGVNISTEKGDLRPRWGFDRLDLKFPSGGVPDYTLRIRPYKDIFESGKYQMMAEYVIGNEYYLLVVISGIIFLINQTTLDVQELKIKDGTRLDGNADRIPFSPAGDYFVIWDFPAYPVVIKGIECRRSDPADLEIPVSKMGTYNQNRLFIVNGANEFTAGDPVGNLATPNAPITFEEVLRSGADYFGQIFKLPTEYNNNNITALTFLQAVDSTTGIGPLVIATANSIHSYQTQNPRAQWEAGVFGSTVVYNAGIAGPRAYTHVNSDLLFMSSDGQIRSLSMSRDEQKKWSKVPISREVKNYLKFWDSSLSRFAFMQYYENKVFIGANPFRTKCLDLNKNPLSDYAHGGIVVMELDNVSGFLVDAKPVWAGLWTGIRPMDMCVTNKRCFAIAKDRNRVNRLYLVDPSITYDKINGKAVQITSRIYTKEYAFKDEFENKEAHSIDFSFEDIQGDFDLDVQYKPSHSSSFVSWGSFVHKAPWRACKIPKASEVNGFAGHNFRELRVSAPDPMEAGQCDPVTNDFYTTFKKIQLQITITGKHWEMHGFRVRAIARPTSPTLPTCSERSSELVVVPKQCDDDWNLGRSDGCLATET